MGCNSCDDITPENYPFGNIVKLTATFYDNTSAFADPTTVTLQVKTPDGTVTSFTPTRDSSGNYHYDYQTVQSGFTQYYFAGTGALIAAGNGSFNVNDQWC